MAKQNTDRVERDAQEQSEPDPAREAQRHAQHLRDEQADDAHPAGNLAADTKDVNAARKEAGDDKPVKMYESGRLTRAGMEKTIRDGGSVQWNGNIVTNVGDLPTEADLAEGNEQATQVALDSLDRQQAALDAQRAQLKGRGKSK